MIFSINCGLGMEKVDISNDRLYGVPSLMETSELLRVAHLYHVRDGLKQLHQLGVPVVGHPTLAPEVVVIGRDELGEGHAALQGMFE